MLELLLRPFRRRALRREIERSIQSGVGLHRHEWLVAERPITQETLRDVAGRISQWCMETMAHTKRPYGIDQMAVAVACAKPDGESLASASFGVFRPAEFYQDGGTRDRIEEFVSRLDRRMLNGEREPIHFAAVLFSWGDVARTALFRERSA